MTGVYLYCLREALPPAPPPALPGIDGKSPVEVLTVGAVEAVVSRVNVAELARDAGPCRTRQDLGAISACAVAHQQVVVAAMNGGPPGPVSVVPCGLGTVFNDADGLRAHLRQHYDRYHQLLVRLRHQEEWSAKLYLADPAGVTQRLRATNRRLQELATTGAALSEGAAFLVEQEHEEELALALADEQERLADLVFGHLQAFSAAAARRSLLARELTGKDADMVLNAAFLIPSEKVAAYQWAVAALAADPALAGFVLEANGPWPPYSFCQEVAP